MAQLADYEAAFDRVERRIELSRDWGRLERRVRWRLNAPLVRLVTTIGLVLLGLVCGAFGVPAGWYLAAGLVLAVLPGRIADVRERAQVLASVGSAADVRELCRREANRAMAGAFLRALVLAGIGLLYLATAFVAHLRDRSPWPGVIAGSIVLAWGAIVLLFVFPRAHAEVAVFDSDTTEGDAR